MIKNTLKTIALISVAVSSNAELVSMDESNLANISGQGGVYLSGEFSINKEGGPLWEDGTRPYYQLDGNGEPVVDNSISPDQCNNGVCGLRLAIKLNENSEGWYVIDDLSGGMSFEGLTLRTVNIKSAVDYDVWDDNTNDFQIVALDEEVLQIGLPGKVTFNDFKFKYAVANNGEFGVPLADGTAFKQTEIFGVELNGAITLQGNLLLFPVD
ncbi:MAG: DUF6160 family protein [Alcanivorax sp.]|jgi:hypothetical protein|nr:MAG: hypothetical protein COA68_03280 [Oceanobacter sp.]